MRPPSVSLRKHSLYLFCLGVFVFLTTGVAVVASGADSLTDFRMMYLSAHTLLSGQDPYDAAQALQTMKAAHVLAPPDTALTQEILSRYVYPPTSFLLSAPIALLPLRAAKVLWLLLFALASTVSIGMMWSVAARYAPVASGLLAAFMLINQHLLWITGTVSGLAIALCVIAAWCFLEERFPWVGVLCLAVSLLEKPQDSVLVWLYFLLAGGLYRRRALQTLGVSVLMAIPQFFWVWRAAPRWVEEAQANLHFFFAPGGMNSPGLASSGAHGVAEIISLQALFSLLRDRASFYNLASYAVFIPLFLWFVVVAIRRRATAHNGWFALAAASVLTMLPVYHRLYDAKLFVLALPACAMLWSRGRAMGRLGLASCWLACLLIGELPRMLLLLVVQSFAGLAGRYAKALAVTATIVPVPVLFFFLGGFYLWAMRVEGEAEESAASL